ncbi:MULTISPECIES: adaptor protein MecA [Neobacillus]|jgi:adapter protein MecA 1/2|uniref:Adaptor protein MecA n=1 Tax=Neobacillus sedimentimangrovi TaxID=2699460 RepID=A0ABS8QL22_9BACI|nr:adaptor protein MecA [Neobacillus sedimentimangrovi]AIM15468.1 adaptor protein [Bacillus sp. X1(2014)]MCD4839972.1 adaptor protein MecA [Neobacillus sedimentimangrovi]
MRLERLALNKIKIFLTSDDLYERGLSNEDIWKETGKWNQLFHDMLDEASDEFDVEIRGSVAVEIFSLHAQGIIMIITVNDVKEDEVLLDEGYIEMQVRVGGCEVLLFEFKELEDVINLSKRLSSLKIFGGTLYSMNNHYYVLMDDIIPEKTLVTASILSEFGVATIISPFVLEEYGKLIIKNNMVKTILKYFK